MDNLTKEKIRVAIEKVFFQRGFRAGDIKIEDDNVSFWLDCDWFSIFHDRFVIEGCLESFTFPLLDKLVEIAPAEDIIAQVFYSLETMGTELQEKNIEINLDFLENIFIEDVVGYSLAPLCPFFYYDEGYALVSHSWHITPEEVKIIKWVASLLQPSAPSKEEIVYTEKDF